jgi:zinc/manganese transport system substrate-binding protein
VNNLKKIWCAALSFFYIFVIGCKSETYIKEPEISEPNIEIVEKVEKEEKEEFINIITTNKLLYHMVKDIVKDKHMVDYMLKTEMDQLLFEYSHDSLNNISKKDMFIYLGGGYEPWVNSFVEDLKKGKVSIVNASRGIRLIPSSKPRKYKEVELKENPYFWLNPEDYKIALANIRNSIEEKDPINREFYGINYNESIKAVDKISKEYKILGEDLKKYTFIITGDKFDYFIRILNVKYIKLDDQDLQMIDQDKLQKKLEDSKNIVFLYEKEAKLETHTNLISKYKMIPIRLIAYEFDLKYYDILSYNYHSLKKLVAK